jgi:hypothetical protein
VAQGEGGGHAGIVARRIQASLNPPSFSMTLDRVTAVDQWNLERDG